MGFSFVSQLLYPYSENVWGFLESWLGLVAKVFGIGLLTFFGVRLFSFNISSSKGGVFLGILGFAFSGY